MVNENNNVNLIVKENKVQVEETQEVDANYEIPSYEEFMKSYENDGNLNYEDLNSGDIGEVKGYGPCKRDGCNCSCNENNFSCSCRWDIETWIGENGRERYGVHRSSFKGKIALFDGEKFDPNAKIKAGSSLSSVRVKDSCGGETSFFTASSGGTISLNKDGFNAKLEAGTDVLNYEDNDIKIRLGINADTGGSITGDGIEGKFLGFGLSVGKKSGISSPIGEVKVNTEDCVIQ